MTQVKPLRVENNLQIYYVCVFGTLVKEWLSVVFQLAKWSAWPCSPTTAAGGLSSESKTTRLVTLMSQWWPGWYLLEQDGSKFCMEIKLPPVPTNTSFSPVSFPSDCTLLHIPRKGFFKIFCMVYCSCWQRQKIYEKRCQEEIMNMPFPPLYPWVFPPKIYSVCWLGIHLQARQGYIYISSWTEENNLMPFPNRKCMLNCANKAKCSFFSHTIILWHYISINLRSCLGEQS